jgi:hypothetical protein
VGRALSEEERGIGDNWRYISLIDEN